VTYAKSFEFNEGFQSSNQSSVWHLACSFNITLSYTTAHMSTGGRACETLEIAGFSTGAWHYAATGKSCWLKLEPEVQMPDIV
jgi:hypothetical protein